MRTIMWNWIASNHQVISALANIAMLLVWIAYLQVFVSSYRRQKRSNILINRGAGSGLEARCLISNMSAEAIYIESLIATAETPEERWSCPVTELLEGRSDLLLQFGWLPHSWLELAPLLPQRALTESSPWRRATKAGTSSCGRALWRPRVSFWRDGKG